MRTRNSLRSATGIVAVLLAATALLTPTRGAAAEPTLRDYDENAVVAMIRRNSPESMRQAMAEVRRLIARQDVQGDYAVMSARYLWVGEFMKVGRHAEAIEIIDWGIDRISGDHVDGLQQQRVQCLLALGRDEEALGQAKVYFNLCHMKNTAAAMELIVACLRAARPDRPELVERFVAEQVAGSAVTTDPPPGGRTSVLEGIEVAAADRARYEQQIQKRQGAAAEDAPRRNSLGNYLLMADRPAEARRVFEATYHVVVAGPFVKEVTENVARALRAEGVAIGRANAWALAHR